MKMLEAILRLVSFSVLAKDSQRIETGRLDEQFAGLEHDYAFR